MPVIMIKNLLLFLLLKKLVAKGIFSGLPINKSVIKMRSMRLFFPISRNMKLGKQLDQKSKKPEQINCGRRL
jgi:hypothetical protein